MLLADKEHLERDLKRSLLLLAEKELVFFEQALISVGTQAALIAGFASGIIIETASDLLPDAHMAIQVGWIFATTTGMVLEISCVVFAMQLSILAPGLALRGPEGSMSFSLSETRKEYGNIVSLFYAGLGFFHLACCLYSWALFAWEVALTATLVMVVGLSLLVARIRKLNRKLSLERRMKRALPSAETAYAHCANGGHNASPEYEHRHPMFNHFFHHHGEYRRGHSDHGTHSDHGRRCSHGGHAWHGGGGGGGGGGGETRCDGGAQTGQDKRHPTLNEIGRVDTAEALLSKTNEEANYSKFSAFKKSRLRMQRLPRNLASAGGAKRARTAAPPLFLRLGRHPRKGVCGHAAPAQAPPPAAQGDEDATATMSGSFEAAGRPLPRCQRPQTFSRQNSLPLTAAPACAHGGGTECVRTQKASLRHGSDNSRVNGTTASVCSATCTQAGSAAPAPASDACGSSGGAPMSKQLQCVGWFIDRVGAPLRWLEGDGLDKVSKWIEPVTLATPPQSGPATPTPVQEAPPQHAFIAVACVEAGTQDTHVWRFPSTATLAQVRDHAAATLFEQSDLVLFHVDGHLIESAHAFDTPLYRCTDSNSIDIVVQRLPAEGGAAFRKSSH